MKKQISLIAMITLTCLSFASAKQTGHEVAAYRNSYNGVEAKALFEALKAAGAKVLADNNMSSYSVTNVHVIQSTGYNLDESDACFKKPSYSVTFVDELNNNKKMTVSGNCNDAVSKNLGQALENMGGTEMYDCGMGKCGFVANDVGADFSPKQPGDDQYLGLLTVQ